MRFSLFYLLLVGYIVAVSSGGGKKEKVHLKIHVPKIIKHHHHTKIVYIHKKDDHKKGHKKDHKHDDHHDDHGHDDHKEKKKHVVVIHKHQHNHKHKHDHGHKHGHKHSHKHDSKHNHKHDHKGQHKHTHEVKKGKKSHDDHGHGGYGYGGYDYDDHGHGGQYTHEPYEDDEGYENLRNVKSERYEVETVDNSHGFHPNRFVVKSSYKVKEHNPYDHTTKGYHRQYQYPPVLAKQGYYKYARVTDSYDAHSNKFVPFPPTADYQETPQVEEQQNYQNEELQEDDKPTESFGNYVDYDYAAAAEVQNVDNYKLRNTNLDQYLKTEYGDHGQVPEALAEVPVHGAS